MKPGEHVVGYVGGEISPQQQRMNELIRFIATNGKEGQDMVIRDILALGSDADVETSATAVDQESPFFFYVGLASEVER